MNPPRIANDDHLSRGRQEDDVVRAVEPPRQATEHPHPVDPSGLVLKLLTDRVHQDFGIGVALEVIVPFRKQFMLQILKIRELTVERESEPARFAAVRAFERLSVRFIVRAAGRVTHVADRRRAVVPLHDRLEFGAVIEPERLGDRAQFLVRFEQGLSIRVERGHARGELAAILHVEQHARHESRRAFDLARGGQDRRKTLAFGVENGRHAALMLEFAHGVCLARTLLRVEERKPPSVRVVPATTFMSDAFQAAERTAPHAPL